VEDAEAAPRSGSPAASAEDAVSSAVVDGDGDGAGDEAEPAADESPRESDDEFYTDASETDSAGASDVDVDAPVQRQSRKKDRTVRGILEKQRETYGSTEGEPPEQKYVASGPSPQEASDMAAKVKAARDEADAARQAAEDEAATAALAAKPATGKMAGLKALKAGGKKGVRRNSKTDITPPPLPPPEPENPRPSSITPPPPPPEKPERVRERLMRSPDISGAIKRWWKQLGAGDTGVMSHRTYVELNIKLLFLLGEVHDPADAVEAGAYTRSRHS